MSFHLRIWASMFVYYIHNLVMLLCDSRQLCIKSILFLTLFIFLYFDIRSNLSSYWVWTLSCMSRDLRPSNGKMINHCLFYNNQKTCTNFSPRNFLCMWTSYPLRFTTVSFGRLHGRNALRICLRILLKLVVNRFLEFQYLNGSTYVSLFWVF